MATIRETLKQLAADTLPDYTYLFEDWDTASCASYQPVVRQRYATAGFTTP